MSFHPLVLDDLRNEEKGRIRKTPFEHQLDAFEAMKKCFDFDKDQGKGGLLVLPTGSGKTFTTVKWVCDNVVSRNIRILWLANAYYLLPLQSSEQQAGEIPACVNRLRCTVSGPELSPAL
jgi:predicted helicase